MPATPAPHGPPGGRYARWRDLPVDLLGTVGDAIDNGVAQARALRRPRQEALDIWLVKRDRHANPVVRDPLRSL